MPDRYGDATVAPSRSRLALLAAGVGSGLVIVVIAVLIVVTRLLSPGGASAGNGGAGNGGPAGGTAGAIGTFGVATTTARCPSAAVPGAGARCTASPECWDGVLEEEGVITLTPLPCKGAHTWQTFAIGIMPSDIATYNVNIVQADPTVRAVCSYLVLMRSRVGPARLIPQRRWSIQVAPPDEEAYNTGVRVYRCLASAGGFNGAHASQFGS